MLFNNVTVAQTIVATLFHCNGPLQFPVANLVKSLSLYISIATTMVTDLLFNSNPQSISTNNKTKLQYFVLPNTLYMLQHFNTIYSKLI